MTKNEFWGKEFRTNNFSFLKLKNMAYATLVSDTEIIDLVHHETMIGRDPKADIVFNLYSHFR